VAQFEDTWVLRIDSDISKSLAAMETRLQRVERGMGRVSRKAKGASTGLRKVSKSAKKTTDNAANLSKAVEGAAQGLGISALSGERLANVWLAAGAAAGTLLFAVGALVSKGIKAYIQSSEEATAATERLTLAQDRFFVALGKAAAGGEDVEQSIDNMAGAFDRMTTRVNANSGEIRDAMFLIVAGVQGAIEVLSATTLGATVTPLAIIIDGLRAAVGFLGLAIVGMAEAWIEAMNLVGLVTDEKLKQVRVTTREWSRDLLELTDTESGVTAGLWDARAGLIAFTEEMGHAALGVEDLTTELQDVDKALQMVNTATKVGTTAAAKSSKGFRKMETAAERARKEIEKLFAFEKVEANAKKFQKLLDDIEKGVGGPREGLTAEKAGFAGFTDLGREGFAFGTEQRFQETEAKEGLGGIIKPDEITEMDQAFIDFAEGGIKLAIDQSAKFIELWAAGDLDLKEFGKQSLVAIGGWLQDLGKAAIAAGLIGDFFQKGGLISSPAIGIGLGVAALALGSALAGFGQRGGDRGSGAGGRADSAARQTARTLDQTRRERDDGGRHRDRNGRGDYGPPRASPWTTGGPTRQHHTDHHPTEGG
jgi:hypothetical protein